jgi:hypothetical protein
MIANLKALTQDACARKATRAAEAQITPQTAASTNALMHEVHHCAERTRKSWQVMHMRHARCHHAGCVKRTACWTKVRQLDATGGGAPRDTCCCTPLPP